MIVSVVGRHVDVPVDLKEYTENKVSKLNRFYDRIQAIEVIFEGQKENKSVEMVITAEPKKLSFVARETGDDFVVCLDVVLDKVGRHLKRNKEKVRSYKGVDKAPEVPIESPEPSAEES
ncbi:MAG: ribosome hibernation-promoting factor, HPF/YfiA family [Phycisphaerae bacterium]